jgi:hypothetical protein
VQKTSRSTLGTSTRAKLEGLQKPSLFLGLIARAACRDTQGAENIEILRVTG